MPGLLAFHAHPDDESIAMGGTMARAADAGEQVVVIVATLGEVGEIHNRDDADAIRDRLGEVRRGELAAACEILGVAAFDTLGYRDSGMVGTDDNGHDDAFWQADFMEATGKLVRFIRRYTPEVFTAYDPYGGYGHPDHINTHRIGTAAFFGAADIGRFPVEEFGEPWQPQKFYWSTWPRSRARATRTRMRDAGILTAEEAEQEPSFGTPDELITTWVEVTALLDRKFEAVLAHDTQISADSWFRTLPPDLRDEAFGYETFVLVVSQVEAAADAPDLFAGLR